MENVKPSFPFVLLRLSAVVFSPDAAKLLPISVVGLRVASEIFPESDCDFLPPRLQ